MTDITELAQREKFEAWWEREYKHLESSKYTDAVPHIKYGFWMAYQAGGAELVEALEKAQQRIGKLEKKLTDHKRMNQEMAKAMLTPNDSDAAGMEISALRQRIAELEESHAQVIQSRDHYKRMSEEGLNKLAESRTVKLPKLKMLEDYLAEVDIEERKQILVGVKLEFHHACVAAGIKVEAE
ncbi:ead/Ea22-like family protein [Klebsiella grimontii]|uniref:ead/Ea22-like family protein n=1 Tax=Klebsiella grimontii TaxID=2058152 RepID=UPI002362693D|nr:ead/Ea22-like family protein [Klebsiella grimontii]WDC40644.1 ead/Ea22-like family protein [Klebsiella grimontii]